MRRLEVREMEPEFGPYDLALNVRGRGLVALRGDPEPLLVRMRSVVGDDKTRRVQLSVYGTAQTSSDDVERALRVGHDAAGLADDPGDFTARLTPHPVLGPLATRFAGARLTRTPTVFGAFMTAVSEQLVTWAEAQMTMRRIWRRYGERVAGLSRLSAADTRRESFLVVTPRAERIAQLAPVDLRPLGLSMRRASTLLYGARNASVLEQLRELPIEEAMRRLQAMPGVGPWTANVVAMRALGHADGVLVGDAGAPFVTSMALTGERGDDARMLQLLEPFRPHRARVHQLFDLAQRRGGRIPGVPERPLPVVDRHRLEPWRT